MVEEYEVHPWHFLLQKQHNIVSLQHMVLIIIRKEWQLSVLLKCKMENRITQWINSALYARELTLSDIFCDKTYEKVKLISYWIKRVEKLKF